MIVDEKIKSWAKEAIEKNYSVEEIASLLEEHGFTIPEIERIIAIYNTLKGSEAENYLKKIEAEGIKRVLEEKDESLKDSSSQVSEEEVRAISEKIKIAKREVGKVVVGQEEILNNLIEGLLCDGHVLLEGVPGIAKTLIIKTLSIVSGCESKRIQFTADLLPTDIIGLTSYTPQKGFEVIKGPIFANFVLADEINRSPPKTQSALMEAMQEKQVTIGRETFPLPKPFFVMATDNPLETSGVYTLPEAQIDRFLFKVIMGYPNKKEEFDIMEQNVTLKTFESYNLKRVLTPKEIIYMQEIIKKIYTDKKIKEYILNIIEKTRKKDFKYGEYLEWGGSPRATISLYIASKARALINGRNYVVPKDVRDVCYNVLRHRLILNYKAQAQGITADRVIDEILNIVRT